MTIVTSPTQHEQSMDTRLGVLEHKVAALSTDLHVVRKETREGFEDLRRHLDDIMKREADRPRAINWMAVIAAIGTTVGIVTAVFGLAEWRVSQALAPVQDQLNRTERTLNITNDTLIKLQLDFARSRVSEPSGG